MGSHAVQATKILFIEGDEMTFQIRRCVAMALRGLPPIELFHAADASEALALLDSLRPDVVVVSGDSPEEHALFFDSLHSAHPPIILHVDDEKEERRFNHIKSLTVLPRNDSLEGIHSSLQTAASLVNPQPRSDPGLT